MPKTDLQPERTLIIRFNSGGKIFRIASWKYWEIVDELRDRGFSQKDAYNVANWASRAKSGDILSNNGSRLIKCI